MNSNEFIEYWDDLIKEWSLNGGKVPRTEKIWVNHFRDTLNASLMPGPYMGNPKDCMVAILNHNPSCSSEVRESALGHINNKGKKSLSRLMSPKYSSEALNFPLLDEEPECPFGCADGRQWWLKRYSWVEQVAGKSDKKPFGLELCAWSTPTWKSILKSPELVDYVKTNVIPVYKEAIDNSQLGVGLSIGREIGDLLIVSSFDDVSDCFKEVFDKYFPKNKNRTYKVLKSNDSVYVINTYTRGGILPPAKDFKEFEKELIKKLTKKI